MHYRLSLRWVGFVYFARPAEDTGAWRKRDSDSLLGYCVGYTLVPVIAQAFAPVAGKVSGWGLGNGEDAWP